MTHEVANRVSVEARSYALRLHEKGYSIAQLASLLDVTEDEMRRALAEAIEERALENSGV